MKNKILSSIFLFCIAHSAMGCEIQLAPILLFMSKTMTPYDWQPLLKNSNCSPEITQNIFERLKDSEGKISTEQLVSEYNTKIHITPNVLEVINLETLLRMKTHTFFKKITINGQLAARLILLNNWNQIDLNCQNCGESQWINNSFGNKGKKESTLLWQLTLTHLEKPSNLLITTEQANMKKVLRAKLAITNNTSLSAENLETTYISENSNNKLFDGEINSLVNFDLIKNISSGEVLTHDYLRAKKIVHMGKTIEAIIKNNGIELTLPAQALQSGSLGQTIQIKNLKNKKQLSAEIIGQNKVLINL